VVKLGSIPIAYTGVNCCLSAAKRL
jgi:hypothetical protein